jgi:Tfp pilus assembly protein PilE
VNRAKRNEAKAILLEIAQNQERFYLQNSTYGTLSQLGYGADTIPTDSGAYQVTIAPPPDASNFNAVASYQHGGKEATKCLTFTVDGRGAQTSLPDTTCWTTAR